MIAGHGYDFELEEELSKGDLVALTVTTPSGDKVLLWAEVELGDRSVTLRQLAIDRVGVKVGQLGIRVFREMAQAAMEEFDVDTIRIEETRRTSGAGAGRTVKPFEIKRKTG